MEAVRKAVTSACLEFCALHVNISHYLLSNAS